MSCAAAAATVTAARTVEGIARLERGGDSQVVNLRKRGLLGLLTAAAAASLALVVSFGATGAGASQSASYPRAQTLITATLAQLEAAAIRVNILKDWTRQRIDMNHAIRGTQHRGLALNY